MPLGGGGNETNEERTLKMLGNETRLQIAL